MPIQNNYYLPELAPFLGGDLRETVRRANAPETPNLFTSGLASGFYEGLSGASSAVSGLGKLIGYAPLEKGAQDVAKVYSRGAEIFGRPDLEGGLFDQGAGGFLPRVGYQLSKTIPTLATAIGATALVPPAAIPAGVAKAASYVPSVLRAGQTGAQFARAGVGAFAAQYPAIAGNMYQQAVERGDATSGDAVKAFLLGAPVAALGSLSPASATGLITKGAVGNLGQRVFGAGASNAAAEGIQEGVEEAANMSFRPDISANDKFKAIVDATITGGILGGITGGALGIHKARENAATLPTDSLTAKVDEVLSPEVTQLALPAPTPKQLQYEGTGLDTIYQPTQTGYQPRIEQEQRLGLEPPLDRNRPPLRNPVVTPTEPSTAARQLQYEGTGLEPILQPNNPAELFGKVETALNDKKVKNTPELIALGKQFGLLTEGGRKRDIDIEILQNDARQETILEKLSEPRAQKNKGLQDKLQAQLDDAKKVHNELSVFKSLREQSDALKEPSTTEVPVREQPQGSEGVRVQDTERQAVIEPQVQEQAKDIKAEEVKSPSIVSYTTAKGSKYIVHPDGTTTRDKAARTDVGHEGDSGIKPRSTKTIYVDTNASALSAAGRENLGSKGARVIIKDGKAALLTWNDKRGAWGIDPSGKNIPFSIEPKQGLYPLELWKPSDDVPGYEAYRGMHAGNKIVSLEEPPVQVKPEIGTEEHAQTQTKVEDPLSLNEQLGEAFGGELAPKPIVKTPGQLKRERDKEIRENARRLVPSDIPIIRTRPQGPKFSKEARAGDIAARKEAEAVAQATDPVQKLTKDKQEVPVAPETKVQFRRSIEERINSIPTDNAFDVGFKKTLGVLGPDAADRIDVVNTTSELPDAILAEMQRQGVKDVDAIYDRETGRTIFVKDAFTDVNHVQRLMFHEIFGHEGLQRVAGKDYENFTADIFDRAGGLEGIQKLAQKFDVRPVFDKYVKAYNDGLINKNTLADELLAFSSERPTGKIGATLNAWVGDFKRAVVSFLKSIGFNQFANRLNRFDNFEAARLLRDMRQAVQAGGDFARPVQEAVAFSRSVDGTNDSFSKATQMGYGILQNINRAGFGPKNISGKVREMALNWQHITHLAKQYNTKLTDINTLVEAWHSRDVIAQRFNENAGSTYKDIKSLGKQDEKIFDNVARASEFGFDLRKPWELHNDLHILPNAPELKQEFDRLQKDYTKLISKPAGKLAYDNAVALGEGENYAKEASGLYAMRTLLYGNENIPGFEENPAKLFQFNSAIHGDTQATNKFWQDVVERQKAGINEFVKNNKEKGIGVNTLPLESALNVAERRLEAAKKSPYFSLGRYGNYMVTFTLPVDDRGLPKQDSVAKLEEALETNGFGDVSIKQASDQNRVYIRVENEDVMNTLDNLAKKLQKEGVISDGDILSGLRTSPNIIGKLAPKYLDRMLEAIDKHVDDVNPQDQRVRDGMKAELRGLILDILPDTSITRVYQQRKGRQGYSTDAARNMVFRSQVTANNISNLAILSDVSRAFGNMRKQVLNSTGSENVELNQVINELSLREAGRPFNPPNSLIDAVKSLNFSYFLAMSPAYMVQQASQVPLIGWPKLASYKGIGFAKSAKTLAGVTTPAFKIMKAVSEGKYGLDAHITKEALTKAGLSDKTSNYVLNLVNRGHIDLGSFGRELTRISHGQVGGTAERALRWANSTIVYSETFSRLQMALAAEKLGLTEDQASQLIDDSMFTYGTWNNPRAIGRSGVLGPVSPLAFAFHNYQIHMLETLYRELDTAFFNKAKSPEERTAARKFLGGHLAAATAVGGTLGFPAAAWLAGAASRLTDLFDGDEGEGTDVEAAYRNFLASVGGKGFGEVIAKGLPRAIGIDAQNYADQNILPFTKIMRDRRKFEEAFPDYLKDLAGAPFSMIGNLASGGRRIAEGDLLGGLHQLTPRALKAGVDAFRMTTDGYVDTKGNKLPLDVGANDILARALGFTTAERAEYNEAAQAVRVQKQGIQYRSGVIKQNLVRALESKDQAAAQEIIGQAQEFDRRHPDRAILPNFASYLQRRQKDKVIAEELGVPLGVRPTDLESRKLTEFANF